MISGPAGAERLDLFAHFRGFAVDGGERGVAQGGDGEDQPGQQRDPDQGQPDLQPGDPAVLAARLRAAPTGAAGAWSQLFRLVRHEPPIWHTSAGGG